MLVVLSDKSQAFVVLTIRPSQNNIATVSITLRASPFSDINDVNEFDQKCSVTAVYSELLNFVSANFSVHFHSL